MSSPYFDLRNGINLSAAAYEQGEESTGYFYASVGAISQFALRLSHCTVLKPPDGASHDPDLGSTVDRGEVWITRSGTPGIAWPAQLAPDKDRLYPSGFLIRARPVVSGLLPGYVAAVLNHPLWRVWSASLAAGKRQRNLSQSHLSQIRVPNVSLITQQRIEGNYFKALDEVAKQLSAEVDPIHIADSVLKSVLATSYQTLAKTRLTVDQVLVRDAVWMSPRARLDPNFHRSDLRTIASPLDAMNPQKLGSLLITNVIKASQPRILDEDLGEDPRVVASVSLQGGRVQRELTKPTTDEQLVEAGVKVLLPGDVLFAMDGYSAGKAALFDGNYAAVTDSHVGILRVADTSIARSLVCFLSSSLCQAQVRLALSGSSAYQLAKPDVEGLRVPQAVLDDADMIGEGFFEALEEYESPVQRVRRRISDAAEHTAAALLADDALGDGVAQALRSCASAEAASQILAILQPDMF